VGKQRVTVVVDDQQPQGLYRCLPFRTVVCRFRQLLDELDGIGERPQEPAVGEFDRIVKDLFSAQCPKHGGNHLGPSGQFGKTDTPRWQVVRIALAIHQSAIG
jgi:hypothetical protein